MSRSSDSGRNCPFSIFDTSGCDIPMRGRGLTREGFLRHASFKGLQQSRGKRAR